MTKTCTGCGAEKPTSEFYRREGDRLRAQCKPCWIAATTKRSQARFAADPDGFRSVWRRSHWERAYGLSESEFYRLADEQVGLCAICRTAPALCVDHDHATGRVRGLLCQMCNRALGHFRDRPDLLLAAREYLTKEIE